MNLPHSTKFHSNARSFSGCWTCRLRRKKCDERTPVCEACDTLLITCYYTSEKPDWMDGGARQAEMGEKLKHEVKEKASQRRKDRVAYNSGDDALAGGYSSGTWNVQPSQLSTELATPIGGLLEATSDERSVAIETLLENATAQSQHGSDHAPASKSVRERMALKSSDTILLMFYLEQILPFLFPFYQPSPLHGGKAWVLEMMVSSPVVRLPTLCQSSYFFSLANGMENGYVMWETVLKQTSDAFEILRQALQVINSSSISEHLHGAVRILASIMQVQRFEVATSSFKNCRAHLNAALNLFKRILEVPASPDIGVSNSRFSAIVSLLGPTAWNLPAKCVPVPSAEQAAFRFSTALLIFDDIIASTILQQAPELYEHHPDLLDDSNGAEPPINLEATTGCQNWVLISIGQIAALDAWKQRGKLSGNLDVMELVQRATTIKDSLEGHLTGLKIDMTIHSNRVNGLLDVLTADYHLQSNRSSSQSLVATVIWAHAALLYLFIVVSGWQPAHHDVRFHVSQIIELLSHQIQPPVLLRTLVWPFCVAGCLAEPAQEALFRSFATALRPPSVFGTVYKALEIMSIVWRNKNTADAANRDLAACFRSQDDLVLLV